MKKALIIIAFILMLPLTAKGEDVPELNNSGLLKILHENRGKTIMLNFFATWCPPCAAEIPEIVELRKSYPESSLVIVGLSVDEDASLVKPFIEEKHVNYPVYLAKRDITDAMGIKSVPHNAFFDPSGKMLISEPGIANFSVLKEVVENIGEAN